MTQGELYFLGIGMLFGLYLGIKASRRETAYIPSDDVAEEARMVKRGLVMLVHQDQERVWLLDSLRDLLRVPQLVPIDGGAAS